MSFVLSFLIVACAVLAVIWVIHRENRVKNVICVIRPEQLGDVVSSLKRENLITGMTVMNVRGFGRQYAETDKGDGSGEESIRFLPKLKLEMLIREKDVEKAIEVISKALHTGQIGDGKIITMNVRAVIRVRTMERGIFGL